MNFKSEQELPIFLTAKNLSKLLNVSEPTAYKIMRQEGFPLLKFAGCRSMRVKRDDFFNWLERIKQNNN